jgi:hypothetical protein
VSNELWRPGPRGAAIPAAPPTAELAASLEEHGFRPSDHAVAEGWWR